MTPVRTVVFDLDGTLVDTAPDLINALNFVLEREGLPAVPLASARNMIGAGARRLIERGLEADGRAASAADIARLTTDFIDHYAAHIADFSRPFEGLETALDRLARHPAVVGYVWSQWQDEPGEQPPFARGLVHGNGTEAREHTELLVEFNARAELVRRTAAKLPASP